MLCHTHQIDRLQRLLNESEAKNFTLNEKYESIQKKFNVIKSVQQRKMREDIQRNDDDLSMNASQFLLTPSHPAVLSSFGATYLDR